MSKPLKSHQFRVGASKVDVSLWEGKEKEGKAMPSNISLRLQDTEKNVAYFGPEEALALSAILQNYATDALGLDSQRRLDAWRARQPPLAAVSV